MKMQKLYWAVTYFIIGYALLVVTIVLLYNLPSSLRAGIGLIIASIVFTDLCNRYFKKTTGAGKLVNWREVIKVMVLWALLSIALDVLLLVISVPLAVTGHLNWSFFNQQPTLYWAQFPMFFAIGFAAQLIYNRVASINTRMINQIPR